MNNNFRQDIFNFLNNIPTRKLDGLRELWAELGYDQANSLISTRQWPTSETESLAEPPRVIASTATNGDFRIIYCRLNDSQLRLTPQRPIINRLIQDNPFGLFIFSNADQTAYHLVNVKYEQPLGSTMRRIFRRISIAPGEQLRTATERLSLLDVETMPRDLSPLTVQQRHDEAFDVEAVTKAFFSQYRDIFAQVEASLTGLSAPADRRLFTQSLFNRLLFIRFLERKGWLSFNDSADYLKALWDNRVGQNFYQDRLRPLFFDALNHAPHGLRQDPHLGTVPYLNGGLFELTELDKQAVGLPDMALKPIIDGLLYDYNFTVTESTPLDIEVAVDPEMLGKIFEELVTGRHESGSYYTPKPIVSFMGQEAIKNYLQNSTAESESAIAMFVEQRQARPLRNPKAILSALEEVKICDPACGSGAYLLGMLHELLDLQHALFATHEVDPKTSYQAKLGIIQYNVYGVDLDPFAVNIARLRLWLSLIIEYDGDSPPPLPNLDFKIEVGDSLTAPAPKPVQAELFRQDYIERYFDLKAAYLQAHSEQKTLLKQQINSLKTQIATWVHGDTKIPADAFDWEVEFAEVFTPKQAQATMKGQMVGIINQTDGQMGLTRQPKLGGFDIVLANPPYVRHGLITKLKPALKKGYPEVYTGTADLYVYFYARALQLLKPNGIIAFISSNKFMRAGYGKSLRALLGQQTRLQAVIDFGDLPVFNATAYPVVLVSQKQPPPPNHCVRALTVNDITAIQNLSETVSQQAWAQKQNSLTVDNWNLVNANILDLMTKLNTVGIPLSEFVKGRFYVGVVTGLNDAFIIDTPTRDKLIAQDAKSAEVIKPWLRGRDVKKWRTEWAGLHVIFTRRGIDIENYSAIKQYLEQFKADLEPKNLPNQKQGRKPGYYQWFEISDTIAYYAEFEQPKIIYPTITKTNVFAFDTTGIFTSQKCFIIPTNDLYLLGVLNSQLVMYWFKATLPSLRGGFFEPSAIFMKKLPIATPSAQQRKAIEGLVEKCLAARGQGEAVAAWEADINRLVYEVYGLTASEIALVEGRP